MRNAPLPGHLEAPGQDKLFEVLDGQAARLEDQALDTPQPVLREAQAAGGERDPWIEQIRAILHQYRPKQVPLLPASPTPTQ